MFNFEIVTEVAGADFVIIRTRQTKAELLSFTFTLYNRRYTQTPY